MENDIPMKRIILTTLIYILVWSHFPLLAQTMQGYETYTVKKKDTLFGISKLHGISIEQLIDANPKMKNVGYTLQKGETIYIPKQEKKQLPTTQQNTDKSAATKGDVRKRAVEVGVLLPLHNVDGDGRRMIEYYRGILMACDSLKQRGVSVNIHAWNVNIDADIRSFLVNEQVKNCDLIFGPLYTKQVEPLANYCHIYNIKLVIPFSISGNDVQNNEAIFQIYQDGNRLNKRYIDSYLSNFADYHPVFIDCNDTTSTKGNFTFGLRKQLEAKGIGYNITNLKSSEVNFAKSFSTSKPNMVILNTGRSPELNVALAKLNSLKVTHPGIKVSLYGYTEWLMYTQYQLDNFYKFDTYIPTTFYYNPLSTATRSLENSYRRWFGSEMLHYLPRFALMGYDHARYFIEGLHVYGSAFEGKNTQKITYKPIQTPLYFSKYEKGGMQNTRTMLIHYTHDQSIEAIYY